VLGTVEVGACVISSLFTSLWLIQAGLAKQVVIKAKRRYQYMVRISCPLLCSCREVLNSFLSSSKFPAVLLAMLASTIPVSILGIKFAMRIFPFWTPEQFSQYRFPLSRSLFFPDFYSLRTDGYRCDLSCLRSHLYRCMCVVTHSPHSGHAVRERSRGPLSLAELYSEGTRVSRSTSRQPHC
jgi:hypothetical protein